MKAFTLLWLLLTLTLLSSCRGQAEPVVEIRETGYEPFLLGSITEEALRQPPYVSWFAPAYESYALDQGVIDQLRAKSGGLEYMLFLGTWCEDSQREVPGMLRVLRRIGVGEDELRLIAVDEREDRYKTTPDGIEKTYGVDLVPTLIVFREGRELGRIVEYTLRSPEADLLKIVNR